VPETAKIPVIGHPVSCCILITIKNCSPFDAARERLFDGCTRVFDLGVNKCDKKRARS